MIVMNGKVILILVDGMRPEGYTGCGNPYAREFLEQSQWTLKARTVCPSDTLPCHMSLFHSVDPERHGTTTNTYTPQSRPIEGLCERLYRADKKCAFFYTWSELRDLVRPGSLMASVLINQYEFSDTDNLATDCAIDFILRENPDFVFLYLGETDEVGHDSGWLNAPYMKAVDNALSCVQRVREKIPAEYSVILLADHGGHGRSHGTDMEEDMTIPLLFNGPKFAPRELENISIKDVAPTIAHLLGASPAKEWEGHSIIND
jgi:predicted AlkP superfamily pyrophosphatase or phosphodiesterase